MMFYNDQKSIKSSLQRNAVLVLFFRFKFLVLARRLIKWLGSGTGRSTGAIGSASNRIMEKTIQSNQDSVKTYLNINRSIQEGGWTFEIPVVFAGYSGGELIKGAMPVVSTAKTYKLSRAVLGAIFIPTELEWIHSNKSGEFDPGEKQSVPAAAFYFSSFSSLLTDYVLNYYVNIKQINKIQSSKNPILTYLNLNAARNAQVLTIIELTELTVDSLISPKAQWLLATLRC